MDINSNPAFMVFSISQIAIFPITTNARKIECLIDKTVFLIAVYMIIAIIAEKYANRKTLYKLCKGPSSLIKAPTPFMTRSRLEEMYRMKPEELEKAFNVEDVYGDDEYFDGR